MFSRQLCQINRVTKKLLPNTLSQTIITKSSYASATGFNFKLTPEQQALKDLARKFSREEIAPKAAHYDQTGEFPWDLLKRAHELGLLSVSIPEGKFDSI